MEKLRAELRETKADLDRALMTGRDSNALQSQLESRVCIKFSLSYVIHIYIQGKFARNIICLKVSYETILSTLNVVGEKGFGKKDF